MLFWRILNLKLIVVTVASPASQRELTSVREATKPTPLMVNVKWSLIARGRLGRLEPTRLSNLANVQCQIPTDITYREIYAATTPPANRYSLTKLFR